jgi:hypothetical protein
MSLRWLWPGIRPFAAALRMAGFAFVVGLALSWIGVGDQFGGAFSANLSMLAAAALVASALWGTTARIDRASFERVARTHLVLAGSRSPIAWAYAAVLAAAAVATGKLLADGRSVADSLSAGGNAACLVVLGLILFVVGALAATASLRWVETKLTTAKVDPGPPGRPEPQAYFPDEPLHPGDKDLLDRKLVVDVLMEAVLSLKDSAPGYVSLEGIWGSGKSSVVTLARTDLEDRGCVTAVFAAFHFATTERLADGLVSTVAAALNDRYATVDPGRRLVDYYRALKPTLDRALPIALPEISPSRPTAEHRLKTMLKSVPRPIVVFLEDLDRLTGPDVLVLVSATQLLSSIPGFVFVPVMDRERVQSQLRRYVPQPAEYLRKFINTTVIVPPPPEEAITDAINRMIGSVLESREVAELEPPQRSSITSRTWVELLPTLRHVKQLANSYSAILKQLRGEVNHFDLLLATLLDQVEPRILADFDSNRPLWLTGFTPQEQMVNMLESPRPQPTGNADPRGERLKVLVRDSRRLKHVKPVVNALVSGNLSTQALLRDQRIAHLQYFLRYRERRIGRSAISDRKVDSIIAAINGAGSKTAGAILKHELESSANRLELLAKLRVRADEFSGNDVRAATIVACCAMSESLTHKLGSWESDEQDEAMGLICELLELGKADPDWQTGTIDTGIAAAKSFGFVSDLAARAMSGPAFGGNTLTPAFEPTRLIPVRIARAIEMLEEGRDPFDEEPRTATWILGDLGDPKLAASWAVRLHRIDEVLRAHSPSTAWEPITAVIWEKLREKFDEDELRRGLPSDRDLTPFETLLRDHTAD